MRTTAAKIESALAWRMRRIEFSGTPLAEAVALFNRQNRIQLVLGEAELETCQIGGIFWTDDPEGFRAVARNELWTAKWSATVLIFASTVQLPGAEASKRAYDVPADAATKSLKQFSWRKRGR